MFINHIKVNLNQFGPATPLSPPLTNQKLYFSARYSPPSTHNSPYIPLKTNPTDFQRGSRRIFCRRFFSLSSYFPRFSMFSSGLRCSDEYKYLGASHCYSSGRLAHISCKSCPQPGRAATLAIYFLFRGQNLFLVQRRRVFALVGGAEVRQGTRFICKQAFASSPAVQPSPSPSTKLLNLPYLVFVFVSI